MASKYPTARADRAFMRQWGPMVGVDEVGRGAWAGPLAVGVVALNLDSGTAPRGVTDSKKLSPRKRMELVGPIRAWALAHAVGWASAQEVSALGLTRALAVASERALRLVRVSLAAAGSAPPAAVLLDGNQNWLNRPNVVTKIKADATSQAVAAASILAKVARDQYMSAVRDPGYQWAANKGYPSQAHIAALHALGASGMHRTGWDIPGGAQPALPGL